MSGNNPDFQHTPLKWCYDLVAIEYDSPYDIKFISLVGWNAGQTSGVAPAGARNSGGVGVFYRSHTLHWTINECHRVSNISHTKPRNLNDSRLVLQVSLPNPLKTCVKSRMMQLEQRRSNYIWVIKFLLSKVRLTSKVWRYGECII